MQTQGINNSQAGTMNSFCITMLAIFHLQTRQIPVLPSFRMLMTGGTNTRVLETHEEVEARAGAFKDWGRENTSTVGQLLCSFFVQMSAVRDVWERGLMVDTFNGEWAVSHMEWRSRYAMAVVDPFDRKENLARSVHPGKLSMVLDAFDLASLHAREITYHLTDALVSPRHPNFELFAGRLSSQFKWPYVVVKEALQYPNTLLLPRAMLGPEGLQMACEYACLMLRSSGFEFTIGFCPPFKERLDEVEDEPQEQSATPPRTGSKANRQRDAQSPGKQQESPRRTIDGRGKGPQEKVQPLPRAPVNGRTVGPKQQEARSEDVNRVSEKPGPSKPAGGGSQSESANRFGKKNRWSSRRKRDAKTSKENTSYTIVDGRTKHASSINMS